MGGIPCNGEKGCMCEDCVQTRLRTDYTAPLTLADAKARVEEILLVAGDAEKAHALEDDLRGDALAAIAAPGGGLTARQMRALARVALATKRIDFSRHCA
jgi:hypothetical protein